MKKSLIALAVLAASGASFAQVSITGNLTYGFQSATTGANAANGANLAAGSSETAGFGPETANVVFTAKEDLGGGYAATASLKINTGAQTNTSGDDHSLTLVTPVGGLTLGTAKGADYLSGGIAGVGAYYAGWDSATSTTTANHSASDKLFTNRTVRDYVAFTIPVGAFTFTLSQAEAAGSVAFGTGSNGASTATSGTANAALGGGVGSTSAVTTLSGTYAAGPLVANGQYAIYKSSSALLNAKDTTRFSASYDLGMAKIGGGIVVTNSDNTGATTLAPKVTDYLVGAKIPMGASSFGLTFASRTNADMGAASSNTGTGYSLEYGYAMSKRTSVIANYARWTKVAAAAANQEASSQYQLLLAHSF